MLDCVIKNGTLVTSRGVVQADVGIWAGRIADIRPNLTGKKQIRADEMLVIPGGVDPHVHLEMPAGKLVSSDTWETGSKAAAFGGTTAIIDFVEPGYPGEPLMQAFDQRLKLAQNASWIDFSFHMTVCDAAESTLQQVLQAVAAGMPSFKLYTTYTGFRLEDGQLLAALEVIRDAGGMAMVHAESDAIIQHATRRLQDDGCLAAADFPASRPALAESEAIERIIHLAAYTGTPLYIAHVSTRLGAAAIARGRQPLGNRAQAVWGETCPHYLLLDEACLSSADLDGANYVCCPPLRTNMDQHALWSALQKGDLQALATDHCPFLSGQKNAGSGSFLDIPPGLPGIELRLALTYSAGVCEGRLTLPQWVDACCTTPARLFGLHPRKGDLQVGSDADIVVFDPKHNWLVTRASLHENVDYTPYEGFRLRGKVDTTLLRGEVLVSGGEWVGAARDGQFVAGLSLIEREGVR